MSEIFLGFLIFSGLLVIAHGRRERPSLRILPLEPSFTEGSMVSIYCLSTSNALSISDTRFNLPNNVNESLRELAKEIMDKSRVLNSTFLILEFEATMKWDGVLLDCCNGDTCLDQVKIKICNELPDLKITSFKILDWNDLFIQWSLSSHQIGITARVWYKVDIYNNSEDNFTECTMNGDSCTVLGFYKGLGRTDVAVSARVVLSNMCGDRKEAMDGPKAPEEIVQMRPVQSLRTEIIYGDAFNFVKGFVRLYFSVTPAILTVKANLRCECASDNYQVNDSWFVTNNSNYQLENLPTFVNCTCQVRVKSLGFWSEAAYTNFMSPQDVPKRNPNLIGFHKKLCSTNSVEVTLFVENLSSEESRGTLEFIDVTIEPCLQCNLLPQDNLNKCQNNVSYGCSRRIEYWPYLVFASTSKTINVSLKAENKAGVCPLTSHQAINLDAKEFVTNFSVIRTENGSFTLSWDFRDTELPSSLVVVWCQMSYQNCQWKDLDSSITSYVINSSLWGRSIMFGVGGRHGDGSTPLLHLKTNICLSNALPLPPSIGLNRVATFNAFINFVQPSCNYTGLPYLQKLQLFRVDEDTNDTILVSEKELHTTESMDVVVEIPPDKSNYMIQAFSQSQGGLSQFSNKINVNLSASNPTSNLTAIIVPLMVAAVLSLAVIVYLVCFKKKKKDSKITISVPKDTVQYGTSDIGFYSDCSTVEPLRTSPRSSCGSHESRDDVIRAEGLLRDDTASSHSKAASTSSDPEDYQLTAVVVPENSKAEDLDTSGSLENCYQKCGKMNQTPIATVFPPETFASPISNFELGESDSVFFAESNSSELKELSEYTRVTVDANPVPRLGCHISVV